MRLVEAAGCASTPRPTAYLPAGLDFDTNGATIRQLMGMRSGIPDYWPEIESFRGDRPTTDLDDRRPARADPHPFAPPRVRRHEYADTNYLLLEQVIEQVTGRTVVETMRDGGVLDIDGIERTRLPTGRATDGAAWRCPTRSSPGQVEEGCAATSRPSPARRRTTSSPRTRCRWRTGGRRSAPARSSPRKSLTAMTTFVDGYGLGLTNDVTSPYAVSYGHPGSDVGFIAWAGCLPESGSVIVTLSNTGVEDITLPRSLVLAVESVTSGTPP